VTPAPGTLSAAIVALVTAILDVLTAAGVLHLDPATRSGVVVVLTAALAALGLFIPVFQHRAGMHALQTGRRPPAL